MEGQTVSSDLRQRREDIVREHMESENRHEFDVTLETFDHPRYELIATGEVHDGPEEVMAYFRETRTAFPDQRNELLALHHAEDAVIVEAMLYGTHDGPYRGLPPTGRKFETRFCAIFVFEEDRLVCERAYFDVGTVLRQLGIAHDPLSLRGRVATVANHPVTIGRALLRRVTNRSSLTSNNEQRATRSSLTSTASRDVCPSTPARRSAPRGSNWPGAP